MKKQLLLYCFISLIAFFCTQNIHAQGNNKFGMSLLQPTDEDIQNTAKLVNSNGGDWGYVTLVIQENDRDVHKWQDLFEKLRVRHLIPIIRLATSPQGEVWRRPEEQDAEEWIAFLNSLNWVVKKRYIVLFNEPNHATEWGGEVDPEGYAKLAYLFSKRLKQTNEDYVVMYAGLDAAAPHYPNQFYDSGEFIRKMCEFSNTPRFLEIKPNDVKEIEKKSNRTKTLQTETNEDQKKIPDLLQNSGCSQLFTHIDAWASHSYPNPGFRGSVWDTGKKSVRGYEYELGLLKELGVDKDFPVFITETGWQRKELSQERIAEYYVAAFGSVWGQDDRVQAVTPFVFNYISEPFAGFSWKKEDGYYSYYYAVRDLPKIKGAPEQEEKGSITIQFPGELVANSSYRIFLQLQNTGQSIWDESDGYVLGVEGNDQNSFSILFPDIKTIRPREETSLFFVLKTKKQPLRSSFSLVLKKQKTILFSAKNIPLIVRPLPHIEIHASFFPKIHNDKEALEFQLFTENEGLVFSKKGIRVQDGVGMVDEVQNIIPGAQYRAVLLAYPYLPRQTKVVLQNEKNKAQFKPFFPLDADGNGAWSLGDVFFAFQHVSYFKNWLPWN